MYPEDRYAACVQETDAVSQDGMRLFTYDLEDGALVTHMFTCNMDELQEVPSQLFKSIQTTVELRMRGLKIGVAAGRKREPHSSSICH